MERLARETGGADFDATSGDMKPAFHQIGKETTRALRDRLCPDQFRPGRSFRKVEIKAAART